MQNFKKLFPVLEQYTYLNTAASGLLPEPVWEWRQQHDLEFLIKGGILKEQQGKYLTEIREKVGSLFGCAANRVALVPNFSYGMNTLLEGISSRKKVLLLQEDYPSVNWPFTARDFDISYATIDEELEANIEKAFADNPPDFFAFSITQWINGIQVDMAFIKGLKDRYPETIFIADGTQYLGTAVLDFDASGLDVLGASTYKWLNAGYGNAVYLFNEAIAKKIAPKTTGFNSLQGKYKPQEGSFIGRFEPGHQDTLNFGSLGAAIDLVNRIGMEDIQKRLLHLSALAKEAFIERDLLESMVINRSNHSSIFNIKGDQNQFDRLREKYVITSMRGDGIRVSFHYFNNEKDLDILLRALR